MDSKQFNDTGGIRLEVTPGTDEGVAVDKLVDDFLHNKVQDVLRNLHEPFTEDEAPEADAAPAQ